MIERLGGRKFLLAIFVILVATAIEIKTDRGLTVNMAGLLTGIVAAFGAANMMVTKAALKNEGEQGEPSTDNSELLNNVQAQQQQLVQAVEAIGQGVNMTNQVLANALTPQRR